MSNALQTGAVGITSDMGIYLRPEVANALDVLQQAIRTEFSVRDLRNTDDVTAKRNRDQAHGWKLFALETFCDLLAAQIADELTTRALTEAGLIDEP